MSVLPEDEPIEELLPDVLGDDEVDELVSLLLVPLAEGELEPLDEPVPEAPMLELELGEVLLDVLGEVLLELVDGEAPIVDDDEDGVEPVVLLPEVLGEALVDGEALEAPVALVPEPDMSPPDFGAVEVLLLLAPVLPAPPPAVPPAAPPPVWATA